MLTAPFMGIWSDRTRTRLGRRRPFMIGGMIVGVVSLVVMALAPSVLVLGARVGPGPVGLGNGPRQPADLHRRPAPRVPARQGRRPHRLRDPGRAGVRGDRHDGSHRRPAAAVPGARRRRRHPRHALRHARARGRQPRTPARAHRLRRRAAASTSTTRAASPTSRGTGSAASCSTSASPSTRPSPRSSSPTASASPSPRSPASSAHSVRSACSRRPPAHRRRVHVRPLPPPQGVPGDRRGDHGGRDGHDGPVVGSCRSCSRAR